MVNQNGNANCAACLSGVIGRIIGGMEQVERLRGWKLQQQRKRLHAERPLCVMCDERGRTQLGEELDHIVPVFRGGSNDDSNLQWLCTECHREKTAQDCGTTYRAPVGTDGWPVNFGDRGPVGAVQKSRPILGQNRPGTSFFMKTANTKGHHGAQEKRKLG